MVDARRQGEEGATLMLLSGEGPDYSRAFVKVPRSVLRALLHDEVALRVYLLCLDRAAYQASRRMVRGRALDLAAGQALLGRTEIATALDTTEAKARAAIMRLQDLHIIASRTTNTGTIVTVLGYGASDGPTAQESPAESPAVHQQNDQQNSQHSPAISTSRIASTKPQLTLYVDTAPGAGPVTNRQQNHQRIASRTTSGTTSRIATNGDVGDVGDRDVEKTKKDLVALDPDAFRLAGKLHDHIGSNVPGSTIANEPPAARTQTCGRWARDLEKLHRINGVSYDRIELVLEFSQRDEFWRANVLSGATLRKQFNQLEAKRTREHSTSAQRPMGRPALATAEAHAADAAKGDTW